MTTQTEFMKEQRTQIAIYMAGREAEMFFPPAAVDPDLFKTAIHETGHFWVARAFGRPTARLVIGSRQAAVREVGGLCSSATSEEPLFDVLARIPSDAEAIEARAAIFHAFETPLDLEEIRAEVRSILAAGWDHVSTLARRLYRKGVLNADEIENIIAEIDFFKSAPGGRQDMAGHSTPAEADALAGAAQDRIPAGPGEDRAQSTDASGTAGTAAAEGLVKAVERIR